jgi:hypothetical protein
MYNDIAIELASMIGFAALVAVLINVFKFFKIIKDGQADAWNAGANLLGLIGLFVFRLVKPDLPIEGVDRTLLGIAGILSYVLTFVVQIGIARAAHLAVRGVPIIGTSYTLAAGK